MINIHRSFIAVVGVSLALIILASGLFLRRVSGANDNDQTTQIAPAAKNLLGAKLEQTYALADFNGDGLMDVAVTDFFHDTVSVMVGDWAGYFHSVAKLSSAGGPQAIVAADFNRDGAIDLTVTNFFSGDVAIFLGRGDGSFHNSYPVKLSEGLTSIIAEDLNSDGLLDLAATNFLSGEIVFLKGLGDGSFEAQAVIGQVRTPTLILSRDFDRDGLQDLVAFGASEKEARLLTGEGNGSFKDAGNVDSTAAISFERGQKLAGGGAGELRALRKLLGDGQSALAGTALPQPLVIEAGEQDSLPKAGRQVAFSMLHGDAKLEAGNTRTTDERGQASLALSLGELPGNNLVVAAAEGKVAVFGESSTFSYADFFAKIKAALTRSPSAHSGLRQQQALLDEAERKLSGGDEVGAIIRLRDSLELLADENGGRQSANDPVDLARRLLNQVLLFGSASPAIPTEAINCGETKRDRRLATTTQVDTYTFTASAGEAVVITSIGTSGGVEAVADLYSPSGRPIDSNSPGNRSTSSIRLTESGTYTILVYDFFHDETGLYDLNLQFSTGRCGAAISCGQTKINNNLTSKAQVDAHTFTGSAGEAVVITSIGTSGGVEAVVELYNSSGTLISSNSPGNRSTSSIRLPSGGAYTILVYDFFHDETGLYDLNLQFSTGRCGAAISCGPTKTNNNLTSKAQVDAHTFTGGAGEAVVITSIGISGGVEAVVEIYNPSGTLIGSNSPGDRSASSIALPASGTYTILAYDFFHDEIGAYDINLQFSTGRCGTAIGCGQTKNGNLSSKAQVDAFSFSGGVGCSVIITTMGTSGGVEAVAELYSPSGALIGSNSPGNRSTSSIPLTASGTYTVLVYDFFHDEMGTYDVNRSCTGTCPPLPDFTLTCNPSAVSMPQGSFRTSICTITSLNGFNSPVNFGVSGLVPGLQASLFTPITPPPNGTANNTLGISANSSVLPNTYQLGIIGAGGGQTHTFNLPVTVTGGQTNRLVRVVAMSGAPGGTVSIPIELVSQGEENALGFSLTFDTSVLSISQARLGSNATGATLNSNRNQVGQGRFGITLSLPTGQRFNAGPNEIVVVDFTIASGTSASSTQIGFGDQPIPREVSDVNASRLPTNYEPGTVTITTGYEADVAPRPAGNGLLTVGDWVQAGRYAAGLDAEALDIAMGNAFQRADCAPRLNANTGAFQGGNGILTVADWVQAGRYAAGLDPVTPAGGPAAPASSALTAALMRARVETTASGPRTVRVINSNIERGQRGTITIELDAQGDENALGFSLNFDPAQLRFVSAAVGSGATGATLNVNRAQEANGRIGLLLAMPTGQVIAAGLRSIVIVTFDAPSSGSAARTTISFGDQPIPREVSDPAASPLPAEFIGGTVTFSGAPAITSISPPSPTASSSEQSVAVNGSGFQSGLTVTVTAPNNSQSTLSGAQIQNVTATSFVMRVTLNAAGNWSLRVNNPDGKQSNTFSFTVNPPSNPAPVLLSISPNSATAGTATFTLTANGSSFVPSSKVRWNGADLQTAFVSVTQLSAQITANLVATAGTAQVTVFNPAPGGGTSAPLTFMINMSPGNPVPRITSLSPSSVIAGGAGITLTVNGQDFVSGAVVMWNNSPRPTTFVSSAQLTAAITAADIATAGAANVTVTNPGPGGGASNALSFTINPRTNPAVTTVDAAGFRQTVAPESIAVAFGANLATQTTVARTLPLPTSLGGTSVRVNGIAAPLFFVTRSQVNYQIPPATTIGTATVIITSGDGTVSAGTVQIATVAPGLFAANANGQDVAAAVAVHIRADGSQNFEPVARFDQAQNRFVAVPIDLGPETDLVFLVLFGTGIRFRSALSAMTVKVGGADMPVPFADALPGFVGLDQVNVRLLRSLIGRGEVDVALAVDGKAANTLKVDIR